MRESAQPHRPAEYVEDTSPGHKPLANSRHEIFAQYRALTGSSVIDAYKKAGGKAEVGPRASKQAQKIFAREDVKERIRWLQQDQARRMQNEHVYSRREILEELKQNVQIGREVKGGLSASNRALELIGGEEHDMFVVRKENRTRKIDELDGLEPDQLIAYIQKAADRIPGLEIDAEALAAACGVKSRPALGDGRSEGNRSSDTGSELSESEGV